MKAKYFGILLLLALCFCTDALAQNGCGFVDNGVRTSEEVTFAQRANASSKTAGVVRKIPVVVSVFYGSVGAISNISDAQVASGIEVLNEGFRGQYGGVDTEIEFCLSGIKRIQNPAHAVAFIGGNELVIKAIGQEDPTQFYNVYIVEEIYRPNNDPVQGYTFTPSIMTIDSRYDGTLILNTFWGKIGTATTNSDFDLGRIAVHEAGHWLNLFHPFGTCDYSWNCEAENDCCCDTPPMTIDKNDRCRERKNTCTTDNPDLNDPIHNFMGYTPDDCRTEFTACQSRRMNFTLDILRPNAWVSSGDCPPFKIIDTQPAATINSFECIAFPNPSTRETTIQLSVIGNETIYSVSIYDAQGKRVESFATNELLSTGLHKYLFEAPMPGIYLARISNSKTTKTLKLVSLGNNRH
jgi:hypothetical protein